MKLRDYQQEAIDSIYSYFCEKAGNPIVVAPTGAGKSVIIAKFVEGVVGRWSEQRILMITHVKELVEQNFEKLITVWPEAPAGINAASLGRRDTTENIIFASIQSVFRSARKIGFFHLVLVDECHLIQEKNEGMYNSLLIDLKKINPKIKVIGFTATPYRMKSGHLIGDKSLFTDIAYEIQIKTLINQGHLCRVVPKQTETEIDVSGVKIRGGEFVAGDLERAIDLDDINKAIVKEIISAGQSRKKWLVFCAGVSHAHHICDEFRANGITSEVVTGETPKDERAKIIADFKAGKIKALTNVNVLTTGFDAPDTDLLACLRPTKSTGLWVQMVGRGMRPAPNKDNCLVLDFAGNTARHGPIDEISIGHIAEKDEKGDAPTKTCPECMTIVHAAASTCIECGFEFPAPEIKIEKKASTAVLLAMDLKPKVERAAYIHASIYRKPGKPEMLLFEVYGAGLIGNDYLCLEHGGYATEKAINRFYEYTGLMPMKTAQASFDLLASIEGAKINEIFGTILNVSFPIPEKAVHLQKNGKYWNISKVEAA